MSEPAKPAAARGSEQYLVELEHYAAELEVEADSFYRAHATAILFVLTFVGGGSFEAILRAVL